MSRPPHWTPLPRRWRELCFAEPNTVLLESTLPSCEEHHSYLFRNPVRLLAADASSLDSFFAGIDQALAEGLHLAGFLTYEAGCLLQGIPAHPLPEELPLAMLGAYRGPEIFNHLAPPSAGGCHVSAAEPEPEPDPQTPLLDLAMLPTLPRVNYLRRVEQVKEWIAAGDTYQVNLTMQLQSRFRGDPLLLYERIAAEQPCGYAAALRLTGAPPILSFSPELFFCRDAGGSIRTRPMKGTAPRASNAEADTHAIAALQADEKNRAEHLMIVDLLRNDLGRICQMGSVQANSLFHVETYATVHQMVSTIRGRLNAGQCWRDILAALFPSGSITGAPKHRTMQLIHQLEPEARGLYTGAIGHIAPNGRAAFSVAIRSLVLDTTSGTASMGVGGGIVADSLAADEYRECLLKAKFLHRGSRPLRLFETMRTHDGHIPHLARHMRRLSASADALGFRLDLPRVQNELQEHTPAGGSWRLRVTLAPDGATGITISPIESWPAALRIRLSSTELTAGDPALRYKTTFRPVYDPELRQARLDGFDEVIFRNTAGELTEGCISTLLVRHGSRLFTPPLHCGVLPGVCRELMLERDRAEEALLTLEDLRSANRVFLCNSVRGIGTVAEMLLPQGESLTFPGDPSS